MRVLQNDVAFVIERERERERENNIISFLQSKEQKKISSNEYF